MSRTPPPGMGAGIHGVAQHPHEAAPAKPQTTTSPKAGAETADTVRISGQATMLSRLFHTDDPSTASETYSPGNAPSSGSIYKFLTPPDRDMIASVYQYAQDNGIDLRKVDALAFDLGCYRSSDRSTHAGFSPNLDQDGNPVLAELNASDEGTAIRLLTSKAIRDSALPEDFLRHKLDPALSPVRAVDLGFLEEIVYATSPSGAEPDPVAVPGPRPKDRLAQWNAHREILPNGTPELGGTPQPATSKPTEEGIRFDQRSTMHLRIQTAENLLRALSDARAENDAARPAALTRLPISSLPDARPIQFPALPQD